MLYIILKIAGSGVTRGIGIDIYSAAFYVVVNDYFSLDCFISSYMHRCSNLGDECCRLIIRMVKVFTAYMATKTKKNYNFNFFLAPSTEN